MTSHISSSFISSEQRHDDRSLLTVVGLAVLLFASTGVSLSLGELSYRVRGRCEGVSSAAK